MSDIRVGDVVACVDDSPCRDPAWLGHSFDIRRGTVLRVNQVLWCPSWDGAGLNFEGLRPLAAGYGADRFRKIDAADELFTEQMRACRPAKQRMPVRARGQS